jgi:uncharacterized metal-binding protein YceD (DUF177 family)
MKNLVKKFLIDIVNLNDKETTLDFHLDDSFFGLLQQDLISKGAVNAKVSILKSSAMITAKFNLVGEIQLVCDRSLREFMFPIKANETIYFKFGDRNEEISDEIVMIKTDTTMLEVANYLFDFVGIQIPIKKIHPDLITEKDQEEGDLFIYSSIKSENDLIDNDIDILDPRWEALKKLKDTF